MSQPDAENNRSNDTASHAEKALELAAELLKEAQLLQTRAGRKRAEKIDRMMRDPEGKTLTLALSDQVFRSGNPARAANQFRYLLKKHGLPSYLPFFERLGMWLGAFGSRFAPGIVMPLVTAKLRADSDAVILPGEKARLRPRLQRHLESETRVNINLLGEAVLGEQEAKRRLKANIDALGSDNIGYISVKLSSVFSQINLVAYEDTLKKVKDRLRQLYRAAAEKPFRDARGAEVAKFVNLDMEEYRDLHLTVDAFKGVLSEEEFLKTRAGIVLQAYLPDSFEIQKHLSDWARERLENGGGQIKVRIVKGANLAMEAVEASVHDWPQAPYASKHEVDANFKRMVDYGCRVENAKAVRLGIASHNLFDVAYAIVVRQAEGSEEFVEFEMLEGMADHQAGAVKEVTGGMLVYAPVVRRDDFHSAIAYLVRRLDENTAPQNFLHDLFGLTEGSPEWESQKRKFLEAFEARESVSASPRRTQNRLSESPEKREGEFENEPDTDFTLRENRQWVNGIFESWRSKTPDHIPLQVAGEFIGRDYSASGEDPSRPGHQAYRHALATAEDVERALTCAEQAQRGWANRPVSERAELLRAAALEFARGRTETIGHMILDGGKNPTEADTEISEAVDFANYYSQFPGAPGGPDLGCDVVSEPLGVVLVVPPWNFPYAIPASGILAALVAGNSVILKPAPEAVLVSWRLVNQMWDAGIPKDVLQFLPCPEDEVGRTLITDERIAALVLTGASTTAELFRSWKPNLRIFAETSGKNALIITAASDRDQAIKDLVRSAFGHSGQKCSAASLAILEAEVYDCSAFRRQLRDAAESLTAGSAWDPASLVTPVIRPPGEELRRGLTRLDEGESWLLEPRMLEGNPCLWTPGIRLGVQPDSWFKKTECFGPVLGLVRADNLSHAIKIQNDSDFGLTGGIHSLDERETELWREKVEVGNAYINRPITGAIVRRQPFGGWKRSSVGPGAKAGGPNYSLLFARWKETGLPHPEKCRIPSPGVQELLEKLRNTIQEKGDIEVLEASAGSYIYFWRYHYALGHDPSAIHGESNTFRYRPVNGVVVRAAEGTSELEIGQFSLAAKTCGVPLYISAVEHTPILDALAGEDGIEVRVESAEGFNQRLPSIRDEITYLRLSGNIEPGLFEAVNACGLNWIDHRVTPSGRLELRHYLREQSISETRHRYGNLID